MADQHETHQTDRLERVASRLEPQAASSQDLAAPPTGLFDRIEEAASVPVFAAPTIVEYSIDCNDMVVSTGGDWDRFATENDGEELANEPPKLSLWSQIEGQDAREVWRLVVNEVRRSDTAAKVPFRCDAPGLRRWYEVSVTPGEDGSVDFRSELLFEEERPAVNLVLRGAERTRSVEPIEVCCWCARGRDGNRWISLDELVLKRRVLENQPVPEVVQGICQECADSMSEAASTLTSR